MRAVGYIRVSTDRFEQKDSLENQKQLFLHFIKDNGFTFHDLYVDVESGTTDKRPQFERMLEDARKKKFDIIIAKELSRLSRNARLSYELENALQELDIEFITLDNAINTLEGKKDLYGLYAWLYQNESQKISNRIKDAFKTKYRNGEFVGSIAPYGYKVEEMKLHPRNDETIEVVKLIFRKFLEGWGYDKIARHLTKEGFDTPAQIAGKKNSGLYWQGSTIKKILENPAYVGNLVQHRETTISVVNKKRKQVKKEDMIVVENTHEAIISKEDFTKVQEIINSKKSKGRGKIKEQKHLFTNFVYCADCGTGLWYRQNRKGYICGRYAKHGKVACSQHSVKEEDLKELILEDIRQVAEKLNSDKILKKFKSKIEKSEKSSKDKIKKISKEIERLNSHKNELLDNLLDKTITKKIYKSKSSQIELEINELELEKAKLETESPTDYTEKLNILKTEIEKILSFNDLTSEMLSQLVEKIEIEEDEVATIHYRFANPVGF